MATLILDQFAGADGTALTAHAIAPTNLVGASWLALINGYKLLTNAAVRSVAGECVEGLITGVTDHTVTCKVTPGAASSAPSVLARLVDGNNYWMFRPNVAAGTAELFSKVAGVFTAQGSTPFVSVVGTTYLLSLAMLGTSIICKIDGVQIFSIASGILATATGVGMRENDAATSSTWDDFTVTGAAPTLSSGRQYFQNHPAAFDVFVLAALLRKR